MSALSYICEYSSQSEESDCEIQEIVPKRPRLPKPDLNFGSFVEEDIHIDQPHLHSGRIRSFPHIRGNWPTFVYVKYEDNNNILEVINKLKNIACSKVEGWQLCNDFHISLSRTIVLKYHWINTFNESLQKKLCDFSSFFLNFDAVNIYTNEESSRTFISLKVDFECQNYLSDISQETDKLLAEFRLQTFYEEPSYHMSVLWINGNKKSEVCNILDKLHQVLSQENLPPVYIEKVLCKIGNKLFQYSLKNGKL